MAEEDPVFDLSGYLWVAILSTMTGFIYAFGIGANDVANAFASTVASRSLTLKQAVMVASVFEFSGAFFLGASVTNTIRSKIVDIKLYEDQPEILMWGMFTSLVTASIMLLVATYFAMPVSTTHTVVGTIMGFSIVAEGFSSVNWDVAVQIFISWLVSPLVSGCISFLFFSIVRYFVMNTDNAFQRAVNTFPIVLIIGIGIDLFYILYKATTNFAISKKLPLYVVLPCSFGVGIVCALLWQFVFAPTVVRRIEYRFETNTLTVGDLNFRRGAENTGHDDKKKDDKNLDIEEAAPDAIVDTPDDSAAGEDEDDWEYSTDDPSTWEKPAKLSRSVSKKVHEPKVETPPEPEVAPEPEDEEEDTPKRTGLSASLHKHGKRFADNTYNQDLRAQSLHENEGAAEIWAHGEVFDPKAEELFTYIQVFTACLNSFAHGANDVANAIAPVSAVLSIYHTGSAESKSTVPKWILAYGGVGLVVGLLIFGYRVMKSIGYKLTMLSPSRGACAELSASLFVVTASFLGIPVSSTQCIVGAVAGVGLSSGVKNVQWWFLARVCLSWVIIFFTSTVFSAAVFSFGVFAPTLQAPTIQV
jgi:phosphate/sulfate permease